MCGRYTLTAEQKAIVKKFGIKALKGQRGRFNIAPSQPVVAVRQNEHTRDREASIFNWGLVPFWAKDPNVGYKMINARSETAAEKSSFRGPMRHHRCIIPATGFYEWKRHAGNKLPYYFTSPKEEILAFAGLWEHWASPDGSEIESCTILTTGATPWMRTYHDRMPVILEKRDFERWLDVDLQRPKDIADLLKAPENDFLQCHPVSTEVNSVKNDSPDLIEAVELPKSQSQTSFDFGI